MPRRRKTGGRRKPKYQMARRRGRRGAMRGKGFMSFLKKAGKWLKKTKLLSRSGKMLGSMGVPYVGAAGTAAGLAGYGRRKRTVRRRRRRGKGSSLAGGGSSLAGGRRAGRPCGSGVYLAGAGHYGSGKKRYPRGITY